MILFACEESSAGTPLWLAIVGAVGAILLAAVLAAMFHHWSWLRERRLDRFLSLLEAFRSSASKSAAAVQAANIYGIDEDRGNLRTYVVPAVDSFDTFYAARDLAAIVAPDLDDEGETASPLSQAVNEMVEFVWDLRHTAPLGPPGIEARQPEQVDFAAVNRQASEIVGRFRIAVRRNVGSFSVRGLIGQVLRSPFRRG